MRPSNIGGTEYRVRATTDFGEMRRVCRAFDRDDAMEQLLSYCFSEGLAVDIDTVEIAGPGGTTRAARRTSQDTDGGDLAA
ncbi:MAG: hypothetical protein H7338_18965 [Candidatus Sericytochromatia bacterium]|nr:hypothetical protein [Candidatus Sericytochromatia bacterium]